MAVNLANSHFRRLVAERKARRRMTPVAEIGEATGPDDLALREQVSKLPRLLREALILHYYLDLELVEVADRMETTVPAVKSLLHRAVGRLRATYTDLTEVPDVI